MAAHLLVSGLAAAFMVSMPLQAPSAHPLQAAAARLPLAVGDAASAEVQTVVKRLHSATVAWSLRNIGNMRSLMPADDVMLALASPEAFWLLREWRRATFGAQYALKATLDGTRRQIHALADEGHDVLRSVHVSVRSKGLWSTFHKASVRRKQVHDVLAVRVVLHGEQDADACYRALHAIRPRWPSVAGRFKDYVAWPKANGYAGLHDTLLLPSGQPFELQIRTEAQHCEAEFGAAAHRRYKCPPTSLSSAMLAGVAAASLPARSSNGGLTPLDHVVAWLALLAGAKA